MPHAGQRVKMSCRRAPGQKDAMWVDNVSLYEGP